MTTGKALGIFAAVIVVIGGYLAIAGFLRITEYWAGFLFLLQWSLMSEMKRETLPASVLGAAVGIAISVLPAWVAPGFGLNAGLAALTGAALLATFLFIRGWLPLLVNAATMLFLTVATIPHIAAAATPLAIFAGLGSGVLYFGGLFLLANLVGTLRRRREAPLAPAAP